jgi:hypothetical protein
MSKKDSDQKDIDREIVGEFLRVAKIPIGPDAIRTAEPPFPDVLCALSDGTQIAFELTEAVDPDSVQNANFRVWERGEMYNYFKNMPSPERTKIAKILGDAHVNVHFQDATNTSRFRQLLPKLFEVLVNCSSDMEGDIQRDLLPAGVKRIVIDRGQYTGPMFNAATVALNPEKSIIKRIRKKFSKQYECNCPIELLVHSTRHPLPPNQLWVDDIQGLVAHELEQSPFRRVWIFDYTDLTIRYVYPEN